MSPPKPASNKKAKQREPIHSKPRLPEPGSLSVKNKRYIILGLIAFVFILYGNSIKNEYALDDDMITRQNAFVQEGIKGIPHIFKKGFLYGFSRENDQSYRPVTLTSTALEMQFWGNNPHVNHFFNVLLYAITAVFLFLVLLQIFRQYHYIVPLFITLLFVAHPVHTEVVANIKSRDEILSFLFCMLTLWCALNFYCYNKPRYYLIASWVCYFLALLSKEVILTYIIVIPLVFYFFTQLPVKKIVILAIPYIALAGIYMIIRASILDSITFTQKMQVINNSLMAANSTADRLATAVYTLGKYLWLLFVPYPLSWDYSYNQIPIISWANIKAIVPFCIYAALGIYALMRFKKKDPISFGIVYFFLTIALVSNLFIQIGSSMGERFLYTSSLGFCIAFVVLLFRLFKVNTSPATKLNKPLVYGTGGVLLLACSVITISRNPVWKNDFTLFATGIITAPNSTRAHESWAYEFTKKAIADSNPVIRDTDFRFAIGEYRKSLAIMPYYGDAWYNMGFNYLRMGKDDSAESDFKHCVFFDSTYAAAYNAIGEIYFNRGKYAEAANWFVRSTRANPYFADAYGNAGAAYGNTGNYDLAIEYYQKALQYNPDMPQVRENMHRVDSVVQSKKTPHL